MIEWILRSLFIIHLWKRRETHNRTINCLLHTLAQWKPIDQVTNTWRHKLFRSLGVVVDIMPRKKRTDTLGTIVDVMTVSRRPEWVPTGQRLIWRLSGLSWKPNWKYCTLEPKMALGLPTLAYTIQVLCSIYSQILSYDSPLLRCTTVVQKLPCTADQHKHLEMMLQSSYSVAQLQNGVCRKVYREMNKPLSWAVSNASQ